MTAKVLIVEDEILVALNLERQLSVLGYDTVGIAPDAETALKIAKASKPDVALVDINLRDGETGIRVGAELAAKGETSVVYVTANPGAVATAVPGAVGVLNKPCDEQIIRSAMAFVLASREGHAARPPAQLRLFS